MREVFVSGMRTDATTTHLFRFAYSFRKESQEVEGILFYHLKVTLATPNSIPDVKSRNVNLPSCVSFF
jgi:hypothetical protein